MRLFIAVPIPDSAAEILKTCTNSLQEMKNIRLVPKQNLHCTIIFLGEKTKPECENIIKKMNYLSKQFFPTVISLQKLVIYPSGSRDPRVLAVAVNSVNQGLDVYHRILCREFGILRGKVGNYHPHITLARFHTSGQKVQKVQKEELYNKVGLPDVSFSAESIVLYSSALLRKGASYDPVFTIKLRV
ncbi:MAG: RNA 2',3'-cyclic phosphodiesterase [Bacteroidetes bacterium]|nr:RNA 2',3'-cyclic phosphodiesterase [Bacteroidota bacterium]